MTILLESEIEQEIINKEDFKLFFIKNWPTTKTTLEKLTKTIKRPLMHLAINILIDLGERLYERTSNSLNITV